MQTDCMIMSSAFYRGRKNTDNFNALFRFHNNYSIHQYFLWRQVIPVIRNNFLPPLYGFCITLQSVSIVIIYEEMEAVLEKHNPLLV